MTAIVARNERRLGWFAVIAGGALALAVQIAAPVGVPLYDGVAVIEPYRFLHPTGDQPGSPTSFTAMPVVKGNQSPQVVAATTESPAQAQLIAMIDAFELTPGATTLKIEVTPIEPPAPPPGGAIAGNVYRFTVTDQAGTPLQIKPCQGCASLTLRAPDGTGDAVLKRFNDGTWEDIETLHAGVAGTYQTNVKLLGVYAVIAGPGQAPGEGSSVDPLVLGGAAALLVLLGVGAVLLFRFRRVPSMPRGSSPGRTPTRVPSKRRAPRRPPPPTGRPKP